MKAKFLGMNFMMVRWVLTVIAILVMANITGIIVKKKDLPAAAKDTGTLAIQKDYCIGCGLCAKMLPEYYEMHNNKAEIIKTPEGDEALQAIQASVEKCPAKAIVFNKEA